MMNTIDIFEKGLDGRCVLVVGDVMIDSYLWGEVTRISPEAPVPVVAVTRREKRLGGAANVALNIRSLGARPVICSVLGNDDHAKDFMQIMYEHDLDKRGLVLSDDRMTTVKSRVIGNNMHVVRVDEETTRSLSETDQERLIERVGKTLKTTQVDAIIMQDYDKGCITPRVIDEITAMARKKGIITTIDPKRRNFGNYHDVTLFKPNLKELREGLNVEIDESTQETMVRDLNQAAVRLHEGQHVDVVMVTLSSKGVYVCDFRGEKPSPMIVPAQVRSISDVSGAGDTVISVATLALSMGLEVSEMVRFANMAGGIVCEQVGVVPIQRERLISELRLSD